MARSPTDPSPPLRVLVADDEAPAREKLHRLLGELDGVQVVAEAADGEEAVAAIRQAWPDLVFLDIQMPRLDGFGVVERIGVEAMPPVVFVTAYDQHALKAFEVHALDYLLKPFAPDRLAGVLERVRRRLRPSVDPASSLPQLSARLERLLETLGQPGDGEVGPARAAEAVVAPEPLAHLRVSAGAEREVLLPVEAIDWVRSDGNYLEIRSGGETYRRRGTLTELAERLDPTAFLRINRSELVRLAAVAELQPWFHGDYRVLLRSGETLTWSRRYRAQDKERFEV